MFFFKLVSILITLWEHKISQTLADADEDAQLSETAHLHYCHPEGEQSQEP